MYKPWSDEHMARYTIAVREQCCAAWATAHLAGTDYDAFCALLRYERRKDIGKPILGSDLPPIERCPWCGAAKKAAKRPE
jgi:hypothetical protein